MPLTYYGTPFSKIRYSRLKRSRREQLARPQVILALGQVLYSDAGKTWLAISPIETSCMHVSVCSTVSSMDLWQFLCRNISSPTPVCPDIVSQWLFAKKTKQKQNKTSPRLSRLLQVFLLSPCNCPVECSPRVGGVLANP